MVRVGKAALKHNERHAIVALAAAPDEAAAPPVRRWLSHARYRQGERREDLLPRVLAALSLPAPDAGAAALRWWGQTGEPPPGWLAAADPVYLETRINHLRLRTFPPGELPAAEVREIFALLQERLGESARETFTSALANGYLHLPAPIATATASPAVADGASPESFLPQGPEAAAHDRWHSEVQMCLFDAPVNRRRMESGRLPVNALWLWGGGSAPAPARRRLPVLFASDEVARGYWRSSMAESEDWPGTFHACAERAADGFVAEPAAEEDLPPLLGELRGMLAHGTIRRLTLLLPGGVSAELRRSDRFRFWRRPAALPPPGDEA